MEFKDKLSGLMQERGWKTPHLVAALLDRGVVVTTLTVDRWLEGANIPRTQSILDLSMVFNITPNDLLLDVNANINN